MKKHIFIALVAVIFFAALSGGVAQAQVSATPPVLYNQSGEVINSYDSQSQALFAGWYYDATGKPLYYYPNGVYYDPSSQSYGGSVVYPNADGPQSMSTSTFTPGAPSTGLGGRAFFFWTALVISAAGAVFGASYLTRDSTTP